MLFNSKGRVFVGQRIDSTQEAWQMPQGGIDEGEDAFVAAVRELEEETGIRPDLVRPVASIKKWLVYDLPESLIPHLWGGRYRGQRQQWFLFRFLGNDDQIDIKTRHAEFSNWCWMEIQQLPDHIVPFKSDVYSAVIDAFRHQIEQSRETDVVTDGFTR